MQATIYCAASNNPDQIYFEAAEILAKKLIEKNVEVVYGGGSTGLMGKVADTYLKFDGKITGIIPHFMKEVEFDHPGVKNMILTEDMHDRKRKLIENTDVIIALPGGCGTLEELMEVITLKRLGKFLKPIIIVNINHYFDPLIGMLEKCIQEKFMREIHRNIWTVINDPEKIIEAIENAPKWSEDAIKYV